MGRKWLAVLLGLFGGVSGKPAGAQWQSLPLLPPEDPVLGIAASDSRVLTASRNVLYEFHDSLDAWKMARTGSYASLLAGPTFHVIQDGFTNLVMDETGISPFPPLPNNDVSAASEDSARYYIRYASGEVQFSDKQAPLWRPLHPDPEEHGLRGIVFLPGIVLAGTINGAIQSSDRGATWQPVIGLPSTYINFVLRFGDRVFVGTQGQGVYSSSDAGKSWSSLFSPGSALAKFGYEGLEAAGDTLWLVTPESPSEGVLRSVDRGNTWNWFHEGMPGIMYKDPDSDAPPIRIYQSWHIKRISGALWTSDGSMVYRSRDGGVRWTPMPGHPGNLVVVGSELKGIIMDSPTDEVITFDAGSGRWKTDTTFPPPVFRWAGSRGDTVYIHHEGLLKRRTAVGGPWERMPLPWPEGTDPHVLGILGTNLFIEGHEILLIKSVIHYSDDFGKTWRADRPFLPKASFRGARLEGRGPVLCEPDDSTFAPPNIRHRFPQPIRDLWAVGDTLWVRAGNILYTAENPSGPWREGVLPDPDMTLAIRNGSLTGFSREYVWTFSGGGWRSRKVFFPTLEATGLAAGPQGIWSFRGPDLGFRKRDGSTGRFSRVPGNVQSLSSRNLASEVGNHLVLLEGRNLDTLQTDMIKDGLSVQYRRTIQIPSEATAILGDGDILLAAFASRDLRHSMDLGRSWSTPRQTPWNITSLAGGRDLLFALGNGILHASPDSGKTWSSLPAETLGGATLRNIAGNVSFLAATTTEGRLLISVDSARSWSLLPGLPPGAGAIPTTLAAHGGHVVVGTREHGLFLWDVSASSKIREIGNGREASGIHSALPPGWVRSSGGLLYRMGSGKHMDIRGRVKAPVMGP